jgi:hypothetical protein
MPRPDGSVEVPRVSVAPPRESNGLMQRTGYAVLAVGGLVVATAFAAVAELAGHGTGTSASGPGLHGGGQGATPGVEVVQGNGVPGGPITVAGAGVPRQTPSAAPTTVVRVGTDGHRTTSVLPPPLPGQPPVPIPPGSVVVTDPPGSPRGGIDSTPTPTSTSATTTSTTTSTTTTTTSSTSSSATTAPPTSTPG